MSKVTSKLQVTIPKRLAEQFSVRPGSEVDWEAAGDAIRLIPRGKRDTKRPVDALAIFDAATLRLQGRQVRVVPSGGDQRGWTREELYDRGSADRH